MRVIRLKTSEIVPKVGEKKNVIGDDDDVGNEKENVFETKRPRCKTYYYGCEDDDEDRG